MRPAWKIYTIIRERDGMEIGQIMLDSRYRYEFRAFQGIRLWNPDGTQSDRSVVAIVETTEQEAGVTRERPGVVPSEE